MTYRFLAPPTGQSAFNARNGFYSAVNGIISMSPYNSLDASYLIAAGAIPLGAVEAPLVCSGVLLGRLLGANMNVTTDQPFALTQWALLNAFRITKITAKNASISLTTAVGGIYPAASKGGTAVVANTQAYSGLTSAALALDLTLAAGTTVYSAAQALYLSLTTAQGAAATVDLYVFGDLYI